MPPPCAPPVVDLRNAAGEGGAPGAGMGAQGGESFFGGRGEGNLGRREKRHRVGEGRGEQPVIGGRACKAPAGDKTFLFSAGSSSMSRK